VAEARNPIAGGVVAGAALGAGLPIAVFMVLNFLRPDLIAPMLDHVFGRVFVGTEVVLWLIGTTFYGFAFSLEFKSRIPQVILIVCGVVLSTIPAVLGMLFAPVVFAFMYGNVG
jgi:hypothetical protein